MWVLSVAIPFCGLLVLVNGGAMGANVVLGLMRRSIIYIAIVIYQFFVLIFFIIVISTFLAIIFVKLRIPVIVLYRLISTCI